MAKEKKEKKDKIDNKDLQEIKNAKHAEKILKELKKNLKRCSDADAENRKEGIEDLKFCQLDQWDEKEKKRRAISGRPMLVVDHIGKYLKQAVGEQRQNKPHIKVSISDSKGTAQIANIRESIIRDIEYDSNSEHVYDQAFSSMISCGYGGWRVLTRYKAGKTFQQEIYLELLRNPFCAYLGEATDMSGQDAEYGFIIDKMPEEEFKEKYPKAEMPNKSLGVGKGMDLEQWFDKDLVTVAEYFKKEFKEAKICLMSDGKVMGKEEADAAIVLNQEERMQAEADKMAYDSDLSTRQDMPPEVPEELTIKQIRTEKTPKIKHYVATYSEILTEEEWAGSYIPIVLAKGEEVNIEGKNYVNSMIRKAKDSQRLYNYWSTAGAEIIALAPKAPYIGTTENFKGYEKDWAKANEENFPFLAFNLDPLNPQMKPERNRATEIMPGGIFQEISRAESNVSATIGMAPVDLGGDKGQERSGAAVMSRQRPSDVVTFIYIDNLSRAIAHTGRILNDLMPRIYDTDMDASIRLPDGSETFAPINTTYGEAIKRIKENPGRYKTLKLPKLMQKAQAEPMGMEAPYNNLDEGSYTASVVMGPSFATQRMEAAQAMMDIIKYMPEAKKIGADLVFKNLDFKDAEEFARRFKKTLPPGLIPKEQMDEDEQPMPPSPQAMLMKAQMETEKMKVQTEMFKQKVKQIEVALKMAEAQENKAESLSAIRLEVMKIIEQLSVQPGQHKADNNLINPQQGGNMNSGFENVLNAQGGGDE